MEPKIIRTDKQYRESLAEIESLIAKDPTPGTSEAERLDLLAVLIETYEKQHFPFETPDPIEAIRFRMEEQGLLQRDLIPYIGSKSKVSEVLSGKRPLSIQMIRALNKGLGIPLEILMQETKTQQVEQADLDWHRLPFSEMIKRQWIIVTCDDYRNHVAELVQEFLAPLGGHWPHLSLCRRTPGGEEDITEYSLLAWVIRVLSKAKSENLPGFKKGTVNKEFIYDVSRLSWSSQGPLLAKEFLNQHGIALIIEPHLPKTKLDGIATITEEGNPVIGMTLRYDRLDNFWFTIAHELSHIAQHFDYLNEPFVDDLETYCDDQKEKEANKLAGDALIPTTMWRSSRAWQQKTTTAVIDFAKQMSLHPAIVAGKIRHESHNYQIFNELLGHGEVRKHFSDIHWQ